MLVTAASPREKVKRREKGLALWDLLEPDTKTRFGTNGDILLGDIHDNTKEDQGVKVCLLRFISSEPCNNAGILHIASFLPVTRSDAEPAARGS